MRKIIHLDMDCFYAAVEMRERPELVGQPIAVGGIGRRSVVTTCNYEARQFGVRSAMPGYIAKKRCQRLIFLPHRFDLYRNVSEQVHKILSEYTSLIEPLSLDEAYLDVTASKRYAWDIAKEIRARILKEIGLTASAGIASNKMLAKIASDWHKPNGQFAILPEQVQQFMNDLPVLKVSGIGPKTYQRLDAYGIHTCGDLQRISLQAMMREFGKWGREIYHLCRGIDDRPVISFRESKSWSKENTLIDDLISLGECARVIIKLSGEMLQELRQNEPVRKIRKAFIKIKFSDFTRTSKECLCNEPSVPIYLRLLHEAYHRKSMPIRLLGAGVRFHGSEQILQPELFE